MLFGELLSDTKPPPNMNAVTNLHDVGFTLWVRAICDLIGGNHVRAPSSRPVTATFARKKIFRISHDKIRAPRLSPPLQ